MIRLWIVKKLLDDSWTLIDNEYCQEVAGHLSRLKLRLGHAPSGSLNSTAVVELRYIVRQLEQSLERITNGTVPQVQEEGSKPWEI
jgi:hypothetical protein